MSAIASTVSEAKPMSGQKHRSGLNFQLIDSNGDNIVVNCNVSGVVFDIMQDKTGSDPTIVGSATQGTTISGGKLTTDTNYYIANPKGATSNFVVTLTQN